MTKVETNRIFIEGFGKRGEGIGKRGEGFEMGDSGIRLHDGAESHPPAHPIRRRMNP